MRFAPVSLLLLSVGSTDVEFPILDDALTESSALTSVAPTIWIAPRLLAAGGSRPLKEGKRVIEAYSDEFLAALSPRMRNHAYLQPQLDEAFDEFTPDLTTNFEYVRGLGNLTLGRRIAKGYFAVIFEVIERPDLLIKYQCNCDQMDDDVHPLLLDFWLGSEASRAGLSPQPHFVSPAAAFPLERTMKTDIWLENDDEWASCRDKGGVFRYLLIDNAGSSLGQVMTTLPDGRFDVGQSLDLGIKLIVLLQSLHKIGIVHGDVHPGNICLGKDGNLQLIDFGCSFYTELERDAQVIDSLSFVHPGLSPWQLQGRQTARRDDVYKAMSLMAHLMIGPKYSALAEFKEKIGGRELMAWKQAGPFFASTTKEYAFDPIGESPLVPEGKRKVLTSRLEAAFRMVVGIRSPVREISYHLIADVIRGVRGMLFDSPNVGAKSPKVDEDAVEAGLIV